jgi:hypothetical protein
MLQAPPRDAFQLLDWIMSRHVHEYLDVAGRPVGEGRAAAFHQVQTEMQSCPYAGSRHHHAKPMNVSALRQIIPAWEQIITILSWLSQRYRARHQSEIKSYDDVLLVASAGVFLADFIVLRKHRPLRSHEFPVVISGLYKVCLGFQLATFLGSMQERFADKTTPEQLPNAAKFHDYLEAQEVLIGEAEVCAGPPAMIMEAFDAIVGGQEVAQEALTGDCARLEIAWEEHDRFTDHAAYVWNDLVMYVIESAQFCPELADPRLPADVQDRLNACLKQRGAQLLAEQSGLVVDLARGAQQFIDCPSSPLPTEPSGPQLATPSLEPGSLAATVLAWLSDVAGADMDAHAPVVASALQAQLGPYEIYEATVLAGLNQHLSGLMDALGLGRPRETLTASALSHVCGRTLRDWGDTSW